TVFSARQAVGHGHILVNGKRVNIPSYRVKEGDVIEVKEKMRTNGKMLEAAGSPERDTPDYLDVDLEKFKATFVRTPVLADIPYPVQMEPNLVIEFYSR
ncbi:MAG TPA: 30S ribosomal protein S4, partial [Rhodobiaceae bacterium]|nr:30S ribosomal protein S4 [Rhodobiaceae bacterium]